MDDDEAIGRQTIRHDEDDRRGGNYMRRSGAVKTKWTTRQEGRCGKWAANDTNGQERTIAMRSGSRRLQDDNRTIGGGARGHNARGSGNGWNDERQVRVVRFV